MATTNRAAAVHRPHAQQAFGKVTKSVAAYGAFSVAVLIVVVILSLTGREVTSFMWGRTGGMFASAAVTCWLTVLAARGARSAYLRVRIIVVVAPIAIIAIDSIPGALPPWFVVMQIAGALALVPAAFIVNRSEVRAAFPKSH
ncbi:hypothetical protein [Amycolatopsis taiwanensis]|uniref:Uncharacterized protein n=1 Tax=Amycolatopsis taiwanensis TaxID=342230 RepID=A0A9W6RAT9_9PSEU|nr:hypothetical protein [Amycolatopsis taiwanensis]GLY70677.1 hypothetical protein Atai01_72960 [Amycolatopsis taiwanensis]